MVNIRFRPTSWEFDEYAYRILTTKTRIGFLNCGLR